MAQCKYCKTSGFHWRETEYGWRLFDKDENMHQCGARSTGGGGAVNSRSDALAYFGTADLIHVLERCGKVIRKKDLLDAIDSLVKYRPNGKPAEDFVDHKGHRP